jgi:hypothetical protein
MSVNSDSINILGQSKSLPSPGLQTSLVDFESLIRVHLGNWTRPGLNFIELFRIELAVVREDSVSPYCISSLHVHCWINQSSTAHHLGSTITNRAQPRFNSVALFKQIAPRCTMWNDCLRSTPKPSTISRPKKETLINADLIDQS